MQIIAKLHAGSSSGHKTCWGDQTPAKQLTVAKIREDLWQHREALQWNIQFHLPGGRNRVDTFHLLGPCPISLIIYILDNLSVLILIPGNAPRAILSSQHLRMKDSMTLHHLQNEVPAVNVVVIPV